MIRKYNENYTYVSQVRPNVSPAPQLYPTTSHPHQHCPQGTTAREPTPPSYHQTEPTEQEPHNPYPTEPSPYENSWPPVAYYTTRPAVTLPSCVNYFRSRGYDVEFRDGRFVVVKRESRRKRRQGQVQSDYISF